jgi:hypothetical protein
MMHPRKLSLAQAIRNNAKSLAQAQNTYQQNAVAVNSYMAGVLTSSLPTLNQYPPHWGQFVTAYELAGTEALQWANGVMALLLAVPADVQGYGPVVALMLQDAQNQVQTLQSNPSDRTALNALLNDLNGLRYALDEVTAYVAGTIQQLNNFNSTLPEMASQLQTIAQKSIADAGADQTQIDDLNSRIAQLQSDMDHESGSIVAYAMSLGLIITIGIVLSVVLWPFGATIWFVLALPIAVNTAGIGLAAETIQQDKQAIAEAQGQMAQLTADVATLTLLSSTYTAMVDKTEDVQSDLAAILQQWQTLSTDVAQAVNWIGEAFTDATRPTSLYPLVANDISNALTEWNAAYAQAGALTLQLQVNNAQLKPGMSQTEVQQALQQGQAVDVISYFNQIGAARGFRSAA